MSNDPMDTLGFRKIGAAYHVTRRLSPEEGFDPGRARRAKAAGAASEKPPLPPGPAAAAPPPSLPEFCTVQVRLRYPVFAPLFLMALARGRTLSEEVVAALERYLEAAQPTPGGGHVN